MEHVLPDSKGQESLTQNILETETQKTAGEIESEGLVSEHWRSKAGYSLQQDFLSFLSFFTARFFKARKKQNK